MPRYSHVSRWPSRRRWKYRYYARRYTKRYARRFINGTSKSSVKVKIPVSFDYPAIVNANTRDSSTVAFHPFCGGSPAENSPFGAVDSPLYQRYCDLYEEVKSVGMKLTYSIITPIGVGGNPGAVIVSAIDRKWSVGEMAQAYPTISNLLTYSSALKFAAINNSVSKVVRRVYASDLQEKITYIDSDNETGNLPSNGHAASQFRYNKAWQAGGAFCPAFAPALFIGLRLSSAPTANTTYRIHVEGYFYYNFRNPKYGGTANRSVSEETGVVRSAADDDDMDQPPSRRARVVFDENTIDPDAILEQARHDGNVVTFEQPPDHHPNE